MVLAASTTSVPAGAVILWPSMVRLTSATCPPRLRGGGTCPSGAARHLPTRWGGLCIHVARVPQGVVLVLLAEVSQRGVDYPAARVTQAAEAAAVLESIGDALQDVEVHLRACVVEDALVGPD